MPYCTKCGVQTEPDAAFCGACGARVEQPAPAPTPVSTPPPPPPPSAPKRGIRWSLIGAIIVLAALAVGVVALYDAAANDGDWGESLFGGGGEEEAVVAASSPTPEATVRLFPTVETTPTSAPPSPVEPTAEPTVEFTPTSGYATPEEAISAFLEDLGLTYVGDCETADFDTDVGSHCSRLWEDRPDSSIYAVGLTFSEYNTWLLLAQLSGGDDWTVVDVAKFAGPEDTTPPWP